MMYGKKNMLGALFSLLIAGSNTNLLAKTTKPLIQNEKQTRGCLACSKPKCTCKCNCCFTNELNFNALSLNTNLDLDVPQLAPALVNTLNLLGLSGLVTFLNSLSTTLNNDVLPKPNALLNITLPGGLTAGILAQLLSSVTPLDLTFEVPQNLDQNKNIEVDLHLIVKAGLLQAIAGLVDPLPALNALLNNIKITGTAAAQLELLSVVLCALGTANLNLADVAGLLASDNVQMRVTLCVGKGLLVQGSLANLSINLGSTVSAVLAPFGIVLDPSLLGLALAATSVRYGQLPCQTNDLMCTPTCTI